MFPLRVREAAAEAEVSVWKQENKPGASTRRSGCLLNVWKRNKGSSLRLFKKGNRNFVRQSEETETQKHGRHRYFF